MCGCHFTENCIHGGFIQKSEKLQKEEGKKGWGLLIQKNRIKDIDFIGLVWVIDRLKIEYTLLSRVFKGGLKQSKNSKVFIVMVRLRNYFFLLKLAAVNIYLNKKSGGIIRRENVQSFAFF